jgi:hypothetical protein
VIIQCLGLLSRFLFFWCCFGHELGLFVMLATVGCSHQTLDVTLTFA